MFKIIFLIVSLSLTTQQVFSQSPSWHTLPGAPNTDTMAPLRFDDIYFINSFTGWVIKGDRYYVTNDTGAVYRTTNGGTNWQMVNNQIVNYLRSTGFFNENIGIIGAIGDSLHTLYRTTDGGFTWADIMPNIQGIAPKGICGISIVNSSTAYACGRYYCPANVIKTTNAGLNWISIPVDTSMVRSLVDCHFWSDDSGFVVGGYAPNNLYGTGKSVILFTSNGGTSWVRVYQSARVNEWCWKIQFVNRLLGFTSIERFGTPTFILKTTNGGMNWIEISLPGNITNLEGIGFVNEQTGWVGGWGYTYYEPSYKTTNGGANWSLAGWGINMNRIRFISDTLAYAVGTTVYKYTREPIGIHQISTEIPKEFILHQNYPNPFNPVTKIEFEVQKSSFVTIKVYDVLGKEITTVANENLTAGIYSVIWDAYNFPSGIYFYKIIASEFTESKKMILIK
ncbi:MAG: T9SS type A sorting domain-containing protein [Ignavibacteria bacterium]|nr:T9SS type A sorting domain-containing protein [Ignavibacteria bacterium]